MRQIDRRPWYNHISLNITMHILNIASATKKIWHSMKSDSLFLKAIINELNFLKKSVITWNIRRRKGLQAFTTKLTEKIPFPCNSKEHYQSLIRKKSRISRAIENNYLATKNFWKPKHCWHKISYRTSENLT